MIAAVTALVGAVVYGSADFFGGLAARRVRSIVVTAISATSGLVAVTAVLPFLGGVWTLQDAGWGALAGAFGVLSVALLYACLAIGPMSILSPLTAVVSAIAPMGWGLIVNGESLSAAGYAGLGVAVIAVVLVGFVPGEHTVRPTPRGLVMGVGAGLAIGAFLIAMDQTDGSSGITPLVASRATGAIVTTVIVIALAVIAIRKGNRAASILDAGGTRLGATVSGHADLEHAEPSAAAERISPGMTRARALWLAVVCGILDASANAILLIALRLGDLSIVSALTALYPAGTILLAAVVLRERIARVQMVGLVVALIAGGMLALA